MKRIIVMILLLTLMCVEPITANASNALETRYATQTIRLREKAGGKTMLKVKRNTRVKLSKTGKKWAIVRYKGKRYVTLKKYLCEKKSPRKYTGAQLRKSGAILWGGYKYTWYSQKVLPDPTNWLGIVGKHVDKEGFICDRWGYICLGSTTTNRRKIIPTPFGRYGKVYDAGYVGTYWFDCYTDW